METLNTKFRIKIIADHSRENPFTSWGTCVPTMYESYSRNGNSEDFSNGEIEKYIRSVYTDNVIRRHQKKIAEIFELDLTGLDAEEKENEFYDCFRSLSIDQIAQLCELKKILYLNWDSKGYCQGDVINALSIITPEFLNKTGVSIKDSDAIFSDNKHIFDCYMWGDIYGFQVEKLVSFIDEDGENGDYWKEVDSCWGFYGSNPKENGILDHIGIDGLNDKQILELLEIGFNNIQY